MKILSCTASKADGTQGYEPYGWRIPSGEPIRILLDTSRPEPTYTVHEYGGVHTWTKAENDPLDELIQEPTLADSLFRDAPKPVGGEVCYLVPGDISYEQRSA